MDKYAGIGSRETPREVLLKMGEIGQRLAQKGWLLRSGAADGADAAFERGCNREKGQKEIFLPWRNFNHHNSGLHNPCQAAMALARSVVPWFDDVSQGVQKLHARNCYQVLGYRLNDPVKFVICWTVDGQPRGGTRTAIKIAELHEIDVINFGKLTPKAEELLTQILN